MAHGIQMGYLSYFLWDSSPCLVGPTLVVLFPVLHGPSCSTTSIFTDIDEFSFIGPEWEWNHNPDNSAWELDSGLPVLRTAFATTDLYSAKNTIVH